MKPSRLEFTVDFSDCDPARIVFYPRYFDWFDRATERLFRERGMAWPQLWAQYRLAGFPIVDAGAKFLALSFRRPHSHRELDWRVAQQAVRGAASRAQCR